MKVFMDEGPDAIIIQLTPETREEDIKLVRMGMRAKAIEGGIVEAYASNEKEFFAQIILPAVKVRYGLKIQRVKS